MKMIKLLSANHDNIIYRINIEMIVMYRQTEDGIPDDDMPTSQASVELVGGKCIDVLESVEELDRLIKEVMA